MPITVNVNGTLKQLTNLYFNDNGTIREFSEVYVNTGSAIKSIHVKSTSAVSELKWTANTSVDSEAVLNSSSNNGFSVKFTGSNTGNVYNNSIVTSNQFQLTAGQTITVTVTAFSCANIVNNKGVGLGLLSASGSLIKRASSSTGTGSFSLTVDTTGTYKLGLTAVGINGSPSGVSYYKASATVTLAIK